MAERHVIVSTPLSQSHIKILDTTSLTGSCYQPIYRCNFRPNATFCERLLCSKFRRRTWPGHSSPEEGTDDDVSHDRDSPQLFSLLLRRSRRMTTDTVEPVVAADFKTGVRGSDKPPGRGDLGMAMLFILPAAIGFRR